jgi:hypothetical protein
MPHFVTDIHPAVPARHSIAGRDATKLDARAARAYRRRLAALHVRASDTLRARVKRELRLSPANARTE